MAAAPAPPSADPIGALQKLHVLVTGGAGYIGSHAALRLLQSGHQVTVVDNLTRGSLRAVEALQAAARVEDFEFVFADLGNKEAVEKLFKENKFDAVMHFAALASVSESVKHPLKYYKENVLNTVQLMEAMLRRDVTRLVFSSTCAVYGDPREVPVKEEMPAAPINPYGRSKLMAEEIIHDVVRANPKFSAVVLRYFNVIGADPEGRIGESPPKELRGSFGRISTACFEAATGKLPSIKILGTNHATPDGTCVRDYIHVVDLVNAHLAAMEALKEGDFRVYNVGTGKGSSVREFVNAFKEVCEQPVEVEEVSEARPGDAAAIWCDPSKIKRELKWEPQFTDLRDALRHAWNWHKEHVC